MKFGAIHGGAKQGRGMRQGCLLLLLASAAGVSQARAGEFDCIIEPRAVLEIRSPLEGTVETMNVDRGDLVTKGQVLAELDTSVDSAQAAIAKHRSKMEGAVRSGESRVEFTTRKSARNEDLYKQSFVSAEARDQAETERRLAEAELRDARDNRKLAALEYARQMAVIHQKTITSPVNGVVMERLLNPGEFAEAGVGRKPMLKLADIDTLHVEVLLPASAYAKVTRGMKIEVTAEVPANARYWATVKVLDRVLDAASGTFGVRMELPNPQRKILAGIHCKANFPGIEERTAWQLSPATVERFPKQQIQKSGVQK